MISNTAPELKKMRLKRRKTQEVGDLEKAKGLTPSGIGADTKAWRSVSCNDNHRNRDNNTTLEVWKNSPKSVSCII